MRALFLLLVLANVAFAAWSRFLVEPDPGSDPQPLARQVEPDRLRIVRPAGRGGAAKPAAASAAALPPGCIEWGSFTLADAPRAEKLLEPLALGARLSQRRTEETAGWWVFMPPQGNRPNALKKAAELKALNVEDYFIVQEEGPNRWAISLGVFRTEEAAEGRLAALRDKGVRTAQVGPREAQVPKVWLQVADADAALGARLREIAKAIEGSEVRACP
jgi:hypothetical protein